MEHLRVEDHGYFMVSYLAVGDALCWFEKLHLEAPSSLFTVPLGCNLPHPVRPRDVLTAPLPETGRHVR